MEISLYDIGSNILLATINSYVYFVLVFSFYWNKRRYRQRSFTMIYLFYCFSIGLARRFGLRMFTTRIPLISVWEIVFSLIDLLLLWYCFDTTIWKALFLVLFYQTGYPLSYLIVKSGLTNLTNMTLSETFPFHARFMHEMTLMAMAVLLFYLLVILAGAIYRMSQPPKIIPRHLVGLLLPTLLYLLGYVFVFPYMVGVMNDSFPFVIGAILFVINVATWLLYMDLDKKNIRLYYMNKHYEEQELYFSQLQENTNRIRKHAHDERKHHVHMMGLLQQKEYRRLREYLASLTQSAAELGSLFITGNQDIDIVLNAKIVEAEMAGCRIMVNGKLPNSLEINPVDCCILLGNCLDNAIHACIQTNDRNITVEFAYFKNILLIQVKNACISVRRRIFHPENRQNTRQTGASHGMGMEIMEAVAKKYQGSFTAINENNIFTTEIILQVSAQSKIAASQI